MAKQISLQYLAGFFDGEGCVSFHNREKGSRSPVLCISVFQRVPEIPKEFVRRFGGIIIKTGNGKLAGDGFRWRATTVKAYYALQALLPFLRVKKKQAVVGMKLASRSMLNVKHKHISSKELKLREGLVWQLRRLNHR